MIIFLPIAIGKLPISGDALNELKLKVFNAKGTKVNVNIKTTTIPTAIIFPNSITGFISPEISERNAMPVVRTAKKQGINI